LTDLPEEAAIDLEAYSHYETKSAVIIPLSVEKGKILGLLTFAVTQPKLVIFLLSEAKFFKNSASKLTFRTLQSEFKVNFLVFKFK
jgi:hypothetical protein